MSPTLMLLLLVAQNTRWKLLKGGRDCKFVLVGPSVVVLMRNLRPFGKLHAGLSRPWERRALVELAAT